MRVYVSQGSAPESTVDEVGTDPGAWTSGGYDPVWVEGVLAARGGELTVPDPYVMHIEFDHFHGFSVYTAIVSRKFSV